MVNKMQSSRLTKNVGFLLTDKIIIDREDLSKDLTLNTLRLTDMVVEDIVVSGTATINNLIYNAIQVIPGEITGTNAIFSGSVTSNSITTNSITTNSINVDDITSTGTLFINNISSNSIINNGDIHGNVGVFTSLEVLGDINYSGALQNTSDSRLKNVIGGLSNSLEKINLLNPVKYTRIDKVSNFRDNKVEIGLLAQEVYSVYPELVEISKKGLYSIDYTRLTSVLIQCVKDLTFCVKDLEYSVNDLKKEIEELKGN